MYIYLTMEICKNKLLEEIFTHSRQVPFWFIFIRSWRINTYLSEVNLSDQSSDLPIKQQNNLGSEEDLMKPCSQEDEEIIASFITPAPKTSPLIPMSLNQEISQPEEKFHDRQQFWIRIADTKERREQAGLLVDRMYAWRGFTHEHIIRETPHTITLVSYGRDGRVIGTITIGMDTPGETLLAEETFPEEIAKLRAQNKKIAEFNALAIDSNIRSKLLIARLFHIAMLYPYGLYGYTDCVIEVNPDHVRFYEKMLEFDRLGDGKICPRVNAVGVLMHKDFSSVIEKIKLLGGLKDKSSDRTLYAYAFDSKDAEGILERLKRMQNHPENS